jgi:hypothetical protein
MSTHPPAVVVYNTCQQAENAVRDLQRTGFDLKQLSIVANDYDKQDHDIGSCDAGAGMNYWGGQGDFWRHVGPLLVSGPLLTSIVAGLQGAEFAGGLSAVGAALYSEGTSKDDARQFETALKAGKFLVIAHGTREEVIRAGVILRRRRIARLPVRSR